MAANTDPDPHAPFDTALRVRVGQACRDGPLHQYGIHQDTGIPRNTVSRVVRDLVDAQALVRHGPAGRGAEYQLASEMAERLDAAAQALQPPGELRPLQRLVVVGGDLVDVADVLRARALSDGVVWFARVEGVEAQLLLVLDREGPAGDADRLVAALSAAGLRASRALVEEIGVGGVLQDQLASLRRVARAARPG